MTEIKFFRLLLVMVAALALFVGGGWAYLVQKQRATEAAISVAFGDYNRYIAACGDTKEGAAWDLAERAYDTVKRLSASRDAYEEQAELLMWVGFVVGPSLVVLFYALRWAMTGKLRPLWLLRTSRRQQ